MLRTMNMPLGRNSNIYIYNTACNARAPGTKQSRSTSTSNPSKPHICPSQRADQSYQRRYYSSAEAFATGSKTSTWLPLEKLAEQVFHHQTMLQTCATGDKPSTWFPPGGLVKKALLTSRRALEWEESASHHLSHLLALISENGPMKGSALHHTHAPT